MFKLVKLLAFAALGYFLYEMYLGLTGQPSSMNQGHAAENPGPDAWKGTPDRGEPVHVEDAAGATSTRYVGRGVVQR